MSMRMGDLAKRKEPEEPAKAAPQCASQSDRRGVRLVVKRKLRAAQCRWKTSTSICWR